MRRDPLLLELVAWIAAKGRLTEGFLADPDHPTANWLYGVAEGQSVKVNPIPETLDTVIHEVLHVIRPHWTERGIRRRTKALLRTMSDPELQTVYEIYRERVRKDRRRARTNISGVLPPSRGATGRDREKESLQPDGAGRTEPPV